MPAKDRKCKNYRKCRHFIFRDNSTGFCKGCFDASHTSKPKATNPRETIQQDLAKRRADAALITLRGTYKEALKTIAQQKTMLDVSTVLGAGLDTYRIAPKQGQGTSEGVAVALLSDWHVEEKVGREVGGLNVFNHDVCHRRGTRLFQSLHRLVKLLQQDIRIETLILALLGDFISNDIHEEFADLSSVPPTEAIVIAQNLLLSGINFLLEQLPKITLIIPCHSGNHARTTKTTRFSAENGHSLEYLMYLHLAAYYRSESRVKFLIADGYHSYIKVFDKTIRFHHGHAVKYGGGIGGIFIPTYKAISQWDKARHADLDAFGHFHQLKDGGNFLCNGSLIGYNGFALAIKADYEVPRQTLFLMDKKRGRTCTWPILLT